MPIIEMSETDAITRAKNGDVTGYEALYHLHKRHTYSLCLRCTGNVSDAEDLTQDVFMQVFRKISTFRGEAKFATWLHRVALNNVLMYARRERRNQVSLETLSEWTVCRMQSSLRTPTDRVALGRALRSLSAPSRDTVLLHDVKGFTHREIARQLGVTAAASKSQLHRAHLALRHVLEHGVDPRRLVPGGSGSN